MMQAKAGDVYCVYNRYLKKYTACQITKIEEAKGCDSFVRLDRRTAA